MQHPVLTQDELALTVELMYTEGASTRDSRALVFRLCFSTLAGERLFTCSTRFARQAPASFPPAGRVECRIPSLPLTPGQYLLDIQCKAGNVVLDHVWNAGRVTVVTGDFFGSGRLPPPTDGPLLVDHFWRIEPSETVSSLSMAVNG